MRTRPATATTAICAATLLIAACAPTSEPIDGIGGDTPTPAATADPTPSGGTNSDSGDAAETDTTPDPAGTPSGDAAGDGSEGGESGGGAGGAGGTGGAENDEGLVPLNTTGYEMVLPEDVPVPEQGAAGFSARDLQEAYAWAATRTRERYDFSNFWQPPGNNAQFSGPAFFAITPYLTGDAEEIVTGSIASAQEFDDNTDTLATLLPPPPASLAEANWLTPAVADWRLGEPVFQTDANSNGESGGSLQVAVPYSAVAVYQQSGSYYSVAIQDVTVYTLTRVGGEWKIAGWDSSPTFGQPEKLPGRPVDRQETNYAPAPGSGDIPENLTPEELEELIEQYN